MNNTTPAPRPTLRRRALAGGVLAASSILLLGACGDDDEGTVDDGVEQELEDVGNEMEDLGEETGDAVEDETDEMDDDGSSDGLPVALEPFRHDPRPRPGVVARPGSHIPVGHDRPMADRPDPSDAPSPTDVGRVAALYRFPVKSMLGEQLGSAELGPLGLAGDRAYAIVDDEDGVVASAKRPRRWGRLLEVRTALLDEPVPGEAPPPVRMDLPDGSVLRSDDDAVHDRLSAYIGRAVHLTSTAPDDRRFHEVWPDVEGLAPEEFIAQTSLGDAPDEGGRLSEIGLAGLAPAGTFFDLTTLHLLTTSTLAALAASDPEATFDVRRYRPNVLVESSGDGFVENDWPGATIRLGPSAAATGVIPTMRCIMTTLAQDGLAEDRRTLQAVARANRLEIPGFGRWACAGLYASITGEGRVQVGDSVQVG